MFDKIFERRRERDREREKSVYNTLVSQNQREVNIRSYGFTIFYRVSYFNTRFRQRRLTLILIQLTFHLFVILEKDEK